MNVLVIRVVQVRLLVVLCTEAALTLTLDSSKFTFQRATEQNQEPILDSEKGKKKRIRDNDENVVIALVFGDVSTS